MAEEYIRKDIHDMEISRLQTLIDNQEKRIEDLKENVSRNFTILGISLGLFAVLLAGLQIAIAFAPLIMAAVNNKWGRDSFLFL